MHDIVIHNARIRHEAGDLDLDESGFVLIDHQTSVTDFRDKKALQNTYIPEMRQFIKSLTGAHDVLDLLFFQVRTNEPENFFDAYSLYMHCDYRPDNIDRFGRNIVENSGKDYSLEAWDFAMYNVWRPVGGEVQKNPLVMIDASTVEREDIVNYSTVKDNSEAQASLPVFNENQQFYYVPNMRPDEILVLKQLDSRPDRAFVCPHTSFVDPSSAPDAAERQSIDIRFMCLFPK
ncbi:MAG: CmcJ/NvfI family oxidoreductase [Pseudomonadota bacterium]